MKLSRPVIYLIIVAVVAVAWLFLTEEQPQGGGATARRSTAQPQARAQTGFTEEDEKKRFDRYERPTRNAFNPLVASSRGVGVGTLDALSTNVIPSVFAAGEANWTLTGIAEVDGSRTALVENSGTKEGDFLQRGTRWKSSTVIAVGPSSVTLSGPNGVTRVVELDIVEELDGVPTRGGSSVAPLNPLRGAIGGFAVSPVNPGS
ncbi:MAG: hypothetical protein ACK4XJ_10205 [Fimbriimonadaceae bacterium]